jgi:hypothetical protein
MLSVRWSVIPLGADQFWDVFFVFGLYPIPVGYEYERN